MIKRNCQEHIPILVPVHQGREDIVRVCARADEEQEDEEQRFEIEEGGLDESV